MIIEPTLEQLRTGDSEAYTKIYEAYRSSFIGFARKYELSDDDILDIYQDSIVKLYENVMSGKLSTLTSSIKTYLFSIGKFKIYEHLRYAKKQATGDELDFKVETVEQAHFEETSLSERQIALRRHFESLGERCKMLLTCFYLKGMSLKDIQEVEQYENINTVKAAKSRCMKQLKEKMIP